MKLLSLHIDKYKNLTGDYDFTSQDGYIALIGENGSGKSNLLEAISLIYHGIFDKKEIPFDYTIKYQIGDSIYERGKRIAKKDGEAIKASDIYHPSSIIACYSGEDRRLWTLAYKDYYNRYFNKAIGENYYTPKLLYIDKSCWEIALIALICAYDTPTVNTFLNNLGITDISDITISFQIDEERREMFKKHDALRWFNRVTPDGTININAKTLATTDTNPTSALAQKESKSKLVFQYLYLLSQPERKEGEPNRVQKLINSIDIKLKNVSFGDLSEGEKKLILIECITKVLGNNDSILLLDEPDAHTHIAKKKEILDAVETFEGQTILTTHSPVFANLLKDDNTFYIESGSLFDKDKSDIVVAISDKGIDVINGACIVSSKFVVVVEGSGDVDYITKAISCLKNSNPQYEQLVNLGFIPQGSADHTEAFYDDIVSKLPQSVEKIIYLFDNDKPGKLNADKIKDKPKVSIILYKPWYDKEFDHQYYIEDYIPTKYYPEKFVQEQLDLSNDGEVKYHQLKEVLNLASDLKGKVNKIKNDVKYKIKQMEADDFVNFKPLLDQILKVITTD